MFQPATNGQQDLIKQLACDAAISMIGVPFHHQGRHPKYGVDCVGLVICAYNAAGANIKNLANYGRIPDGRALIREIEEYTFKVSEMEIGDVLIFRFSKNPQHIALYIGDGTMVHSYIDAKCVLKEKLTPAWKKKLVAIYRVDPNVLV